MLVPLALALVLAGGVQSDPDAGYGYSAGGRRDPFLSWRTATLADPHGLPTIDALALRGIVKTERGRAALFALADGRTLVVRRGHRFADGEVESIDASGVTFRQELRDPMMPVKSRLVRKTL